MSDRLEAAFVFGSLGNLTGALGDGWSVEDNYAWAIGDESRLALPLPGDDGHYMLRLTLHPLTHPGLRDVQRLRIATGDTELASFELERPNTVDIPLPPALTRHRHRLDLTLEHPDAIRPRDFKESTDTRWLTVCFHSGGLVRMTDDTDEEQVDIVHAVIAGGSIARQIAGVMSKLPVLQDRIAFHYVAPESSLDATVSQVPSRVLRSTQIYWEQSGLGVPETTGALRRMVADDCDERRIPFPRLNALWPFQGADPRLVREPGRYDLGRYPFTDRIGASLANMWLPDDVVALAYESMTEKELTNLDALLDADIAAWRKSDSSNDAQVADFIVANFRTQRLFSAPPSPTPALLRHIIDQLIVTPPIAGIADPVALGREIDFLMSGYVGYTQELPINAHVARHFDLGWWRPDMRYHWFGNRWTYEQYVLDYIRWNSWRP